MLATATPAEVTSEQLARALYSNYVGHAHIDYRMLSMALFEFVLCVHAYRVRTDTCYATIPVWCHVL